MNKLDRLLLDIIIHKDPSFIKDGLLIVEKLDQKTIEKLDRYFELISSLKWIFKKILKYEIYFNDFYFDSQNIPFYEQLEYHIHSYIQDLIILKNKIEVLLNSLQNDITKIYPNEPRIKKDFNSLKESLNNSFNEVKKHRDPHQHKWNRFIDSDISYIEWLSTILTNDFSSQQLTLNTEFIQKNINERFIDAKNKRIKQTKENNDWIFIFIEKLFTILEPNIYKLLSIKSMKTILERPS